MRISEYSALDPRFEIVHQIGEAVPEVQSLFAQQDGRVLRIWTVVPERDQAIYRKVYETEKALIASHADMLFDFNVVPSEGRDPQTLIRDSEAELIFAR